MCFCKSTRVELTQFKIDNSVCRIGVFLNSSNYIFNISDEFDTSEFDRTWNLSIVNLGPIFEAFISENLSWLFKGSIGYIRVSRLFEESDNDRFLGVISDGFTYGLGLGPKIYLNNSKWALQGIVGYQGANLDFDTGITNREQPISLLDISFGASYNFGK